MHEARRRLLLNCLRVGDLVVMTAALAVALAFSGQVVEGYPLDEFLTVRVKLVNFVFFAGFAVLWNIIFGAFGLYRSRRVGLMTTEWWDVAKAVAVGTLILSGLGLVFDFTAVNRGFIAAFFTDRRCWALPSTGPCCARSSAAVAGTAGTSGTW